MRDSGGVDKSVQEHCACNAPELDSTGRVLPLLYKSLCDRVWFEEVTRPSTPLLHCHGPGELRASSPFTSTTSYHDTELVVRNLRRLPITPPRCSAAGPVYAILRILLSFAFKCSCLTSDLARLSVPLAKHALHRLTSGRYPLVSPPRLAISRPALVPAVIGLYQSSSTFLLTRVLGSYQS